MNTSIFVAIVIVAAVVGAVVFLAPGPAATDPENPMGRASTIGNDLPADQRAEATFAAGCFWGVESAFREVEGVVETQVGFTGGQAENPSYRQVCGGDTGHAEAVHVTYDPARVSYEQLLEVFWNSHNPTQGDRQGPDVGSQYRSAIFYHNQRQRDLAELSKEQLGESDRFSRPITTEIVPAERFWRAEQYHQQYHEKNDAPSCRPW